VSSVPLPPVVARRRPRAALGALALLAAVTAAAGGVAVLDRPGSTTAPAPEAARADAFGGWIGGVPMQQASCEQWVGASAAERTGAVASLRATVGGPSTTGGYGTTLTDDRATALFDTRCGQPGAAGFLLYEMYTRAAAFGA